MNEGNGSDHSIANKGDFSMSVIRSKSQMINEVKSVIRGSIDSALDGLVTVFSNQLIDERAMEKTYHRNRVGFNKPDAKVLTHIAKCYIEGNSLNANEIDEVMKRVPKYARQIVKTKISRGEIVKRDGSYMIME